VAEYQVVNKAIMRIPKLKITNGKLKLCCYSNQELAGYNDRLQSALKRGYEFHKYRLYKRLMLSDSRVKIFVKLDSCISNATA
jgi:hypothetical protein